MMKINAYKTLALAIASAFATSTAYATGESYYLIEEIPVSATGTLSDARFDTTVSAVSENAHYVAGRSLAFTTYFPFFDLTNRTSFDYGCLFSSDICVNYNEGEFGFYDFYRLSVITQRTREYSSKVLAFVAQDDASASSSGKNIAPLPTWSAISSKLEVFDKGATSFTTDTQVNFIDEVSGWSTGWDSAPYVLGGDNRYSREFVARGFAHNVASNETISLLPFSDDKLTLDALQGGMSAGTQIVNVNGRTLVYGYASVGFVDDDSDDFDDCQFGNEEDFVFCHGFSLQAWVWDITDAANGDAVEGSALVDGYVYERFTNAYGFNHVFDVGSSGTVVGMSAYQGIDSPRGSTGRAAFFIENDSSEADAPAFKVVRVPELDTDNASAASGNGKDSDKYEDTVRHSWATAVNDTQGLVVGNLRYSLPKGQNRPVEGFIYQFNDAANPAEIAQVVWPLRDKPSRGGNSQFEDVNSDGQVVGWRDAPGQIQPADNGVPRTQSAILLDYTRYQDGNDNFVWYLDDLICFTNDAGESECPLYRIEYANHISDDGSIVASGYRYASQSDFDNRLNPQPVLLKLERNMAVDLDNITARPVLETPPSRRQGAAMGWWFALGLLPLLYLRRSTRLKKRKLNKF